MQGSIERVRAIINGRAPDRPALYDLFRNDAVISHFAGRTLTIENAPTVVYSAVEPALDATRPSVRLPDEEGVVTLPDGRQQRRFRWTMWTERVQYADTQAWAAAQRASLERFDPTWTDARQKAVEQRLEGVAAERQKLGDVFFCPSAPGLGFMGMCGHVGLEQFCYCLVDFPDIVNDLLECRALEAIAWAEHLPPDHGLEAVFVGDDIAYKTAPMVSPTWFRQHYFPRMARVMAAYHARGIKVLFHSDGNLNLLLPDLIEAGIDGLNPIEVLAGMDVGEIHRLFPKLFMAGGIDVSQLLPLGSPSQVRDAVRRALDAAEGQIMIGSSTELNNEVPLENFLAMRQAAIDFS